jgi:hypothetical protein
MGRQINTVLKPGGFFEMLVLRAGDEAVARRIATEIGGRPVIVRAAAIREYARMGTGPRA